MKLLHHFGLVIILALFVAAKADINDVKRNAIKRIEDQVKNIKTLAQETSVEVEKRQGNIKIITKHEKEFGDEVILKTQFEIKQTAKSAYMMANLLGSSNEVFRCIEFSERDGLGDCDKYYSQKFLDPGREYETKAEEYQRNLIKTWKDDYYGAIDQYGVIYQKSVNDIQKSNSESFIVSVVNQFDKTTQQMGDIITNIHVNMARLHVQILKSLDQLVNNLQQFSKYRVEETSKAIQRCFPKFYQQETFFNPYLF